MDSDEDIEDPFIQIHREECFDRNFDLCAHIVESILNLCNEYHSNLFQYISDLDLFLFFCKYNVFDYTPPGQDDEEFEDAARS